MIAENELRRRAAEWHVDPMIVDLDYSLGWFLVALIKSDVVAQRLRFKGGTCLRKCYFSNYRFSEDLDFTAAGVLTPQELATGIEQASQWARERNGPDCTAALPRIDVAEDEYGSESYQIRIYYRGPLRWGGSPRAIRLDITRHEKLCLPESQRSLTHPYSDHTTLTSASIPCYDLAEILAEKLRAVGGQRQFAISRDLYDIHRLVESGVSIERAASILPEKFAARGIEIASLNSAHLLSRRAEFKFDWDRRLTYLVPTEPEVTFNDALQTTAEAVRLAQKVLSGG
jgi:predicted nucleotidyltransferase component of viral defense system